MKIKNMDQLNTYCLLAIVSLLLVGCDGKPNKSREIIGEAIIIEIPEYTKTDAHKWDEIVEEITLIPLETNDNSLIGFSWNIAIDNKIYYLFRNYLHVYSKEGEYLNTIGQRGKGPGEYKQISDFCLIENGDVCILDYQEIKRYSTDGDYIRTYSLAKNKGTYINPDFFCWFNDKIQYFWIKGNSEFELLTDSKTSTFHLHKMINGRVQESYYEAFSYTAEGNKFVPTNSEGYYMLPSDYDSYICTIEENSVKKSYMLDYGKYNLDYKDFEYGFSREIGLDNLNQLINGNYGNKIRMFVDMGQFIFLAFRLKKENSYGFFNKQTKKTTLLSNECIIDGILPFTPISFDRTNPRVLVGYVEPYKLKQYWEENNVALTGTNLINFEELNKLKMLSDMDNPILIFLKVNVEAL